MKFCKSKWLINIISLTLLSSVAIAQDANNKNNWTGFYGGFNIGSVFNNFELNSNHFALTDPKGTCNGDPNFSSFFPGVQFGYLSVFESRIVLGIEGDFTYNTDPTENLNCNCAYTPVVYDRYTLKNRLQGSIRGRLGYVVQPKILPFVSIGRSFAETTMSYYNEGGDYYSINRTQSGLVLGGGLEWKFAQTWSLRAEYYYIDYDSLNLRISNIYGLYDPNGNANMNLSNNNLRVSISYWF